MRSDVLENGEIEEVVLTLYCSRLRIFFLVVHLAFQQLVSLLLILPEDVRFDLLGLLLAALQAVQISFPRLLFSRNIEEAFHFHIRQDFIGDEGVSDGHFAEGHVPLPGEQEVVGREDFELVLDELFHPLDLV